MADNNDNNQPERFRRGQFPFRPYNEAYIDPRWRPRRNPADRARRIYYTRDQKDKAIELLNKGLKCRQVSRLIGPRCSSGTPSRWKKKALTEEPLRKRLADMFKEIPAVNIKLPKVDANDEPGAEGGDQ